MCHFAYSDPMVRHCLEITKSRDYTLTDKLKGMLRGEPMERLPLRNVTYDGGSFKSRDPSPHDIWCHANGWLDLPRAKVHDFEAWTALGQEYINTLSLKYNLSNATWTARSSGPWTKDPTVITKELLIKHNLGYAAMGPNSIGCMMAMCTYYGCMSPDRGTVFVGSQCSKP